MELPRDEVAVARPGDRRPGPATAGMDRQEAFATDGMWSGFVRTEPGMASGWHHHGEYESAIYVIDGAIRMEFGPDGQERFDAGPGDFVYVPKHAVHRESDPGSQPSTIVVVRAGQGEPVFNVDGPE